MILPKYEYANRNYLSACMVGFKKYMTKDGSLDGLKFDQHCPGVKIKENAIRYWCSHLDKFPDWQLYCPDYYIEKIEEQSKIEDPTKRNFIAFDANYLLSLFKSLNKKEYLEILRENFNAR